MPSSVTDTSSSTALDCTGLRCPMPIVRLGVAIRQLEPGAHLEVRATDPAFGPDLMAWARRTGHVVITYEEGAVQRAVVQKV